VESLRKGYRLRMLEDRMLRRSWIKEEEVNSILKVTV